MLLRFTLFTIIDRLGRKRLQKSASASQSPVLNDKQMIETGDWMDNRRLDLRTYEYMCHLAEAKEYVDRILWIIPVIYIYIYI